MYTRTNGRQFDMRRRESRGKIYIRYCSSFHLKFLNKIDKFIEIWSSTRSTSWSREDPQPADLQSDVAGGHQDRAGCSCVHLGQQDVL